MQSSWEVEQKYAVANRAGLVQLLAREGFLPQRTEIHCDIYYRHPCRDFRATDEAFRLRSVDDFTVVTYKGPREKSEVKTRQEIELKLVPDEFDSWKMLLQNLGFQPLPPVRKQREIYTNERLPELCITIDEVEGLGLFAEIELLVSDRSEFAAAQARILSLASQLGLDQVQPRSYLSQLLEIQGIE